MLARWHGLLRHDVGRFRERPELSSVKGESHGVDTFVVDSFS
jgi:hypothetical protein